MHVNLNKFSLSGWSLLKIRENNQLLKRLIKIKENI